MHNPSLNPDLYRRHNLLLPALAMALAVPTLAAQELAPGVVVDGQRGIVYAMNVRGEIEALDAAQGSPLWASAAGARPLAVDGRRLLTQAESHDGDLRLVILDVAARGRVLRETRASLPEGAAAPIDLPAGVEFRATARSSAGAIDLRWTYVRRPLRGMDADAEDEEEQELARASSFDGALRVDLATGRVEPLAARAEDNPLRPLPAAVAAEAEAGAYRQRPLWAGDLLVTTQEVEAGGQRRLVLRRFTADGTALPPVALPDGVTLQLPSADNRHVLVSRESGDTAPESTHAWAIFALADGTRVGGEFATHLAAAPFVVIGGRVLCVTAAWGRRSGGAWIEEPLQLRAVDLATGRTAWARTLRDTTYRGPWAP